MAAKQEPTPQGGDPIPDALASLKSVMGDVAPDAAVEARALISFDDHEPDDLVTGSPAEIQAHMLAGRVDPHPDAVAHAKSLG